MKGKMRKLSKGIIYDDPKLAEKNAYITASAMSNVVDSYDEVEDYINEAPQIDECRKPTANELTAFSMAYSMVHPSADVRNLIIPSNMIDDTLCKNLEKVDISYDVLLKFDQIRSQIIEDEYHNQIKENNTNQVFIDVLQDGKIVKSVCFSNPDDAIQWVMDNKSDDKQFRTMF